MTPLTFRGYGVGSNDVTIIAERITHWHGISYNNHGGTEIYLDTGKSVRVEAWPTDIEKQLRASVKPTSEPSK